MPATAKHIRGRKDFRMDPKYRVAVPSEWRPDAGEKLNLLSSSRHGLPMVAVLTEEEFELRLKQIDDDAQMSVADKREMKGILNSRCLEASINDQGKLLVPKDCSERVGLKAEGSVVLLGRGTFFEIWDAAQYAEVERIENERVLAHNDRLGVL